MKTVCRSICVLLLGIVTLFGASVFAESYNRYSGGPGYPGTPIPDGGSVQVPIVVGDSGIIDNVYVSIDIPHDDPIDIDYIKLIAPDATEVTLIDFVSCGGTPDIFAINFDNNGVPWSAWNPPTGQCIVNTPSSQRYPFEADGSLATLRGKQMSGTWQIEVGDESANGITGEVVRVNLSISTGNTTSCDNNFSYIGGLTHPHAGTESYVWTFCPDAVTQNLIGIVNSFTMEDDGNNCNDGDRLRVFDGAHVGEWHNGSYWGDPLIDTYCGANIPQEIVGTDPNGCLTFVLYSNHIVSTTDYSWNIDLTCDACGNGSVQSREECDGAANCTASCTCATAYHAVFGGTCEPDTTCVGGYNDGDACEENSDCTVGQCTSSLIECEGESNCDADTPGTCSISAGACFDDTDCPSGASDVCQGAYIDDCDIVVATCGSTPVNGACISYPGTYVTQPGSTTANGCIAGTYLEYTDTTTQRQWKCEGLNGGTTATCTATRNYCGNATFDAGQEECEGSTNCDNTSCTCESGYTPDGSGNCTAGAVCGNSVLDAGEDCDTSAGSSNCQNTCECVDAYTPDGNGNCVSNGLCGNGQVDTGSTVDCVLDAVCSNNTCGTNLAPAVLATAESLCMEDADCMGLGYYAYCSNYVCVPASSCHLIESGGSPTTPAVDDLGLTDCSGNPSICGASEICVDVSNGNGMDKRCLHVDCAATCGVQASTCRTRIHDHVVNMSSTQDVFVGASERAYIIANSLVYDFLPGINNTPNLLSTADTPGTVDLIEFEGYVHTVAVVPGVSINMNKVPIGGGISSSVNLAAAISVPQAAAYGITGDTLLLGYLGINDMLYVYEYDQINDIWILQTFYDLSSYSAYTVTDVHVSATDVAVLLEHDTTGDMIVRHNGTTIPTAGIGVGYTGKITFDSLGNIYVAFRDATTEKAVLKKHSNANWQTVTLLEEGITKMPALFMSSSDVLYIAHQDLINPLDDFNGSFRVDKVTACPSNPEECDGTIGCSKTCECLEGYTPDGNGLCVITCGDGTVGSGSAASCALDSTCGGVAGSCNDGSIDSGYFGFTGGTCVDDTDCGSAGSTGLYLGFCHSKQGGRCAYLHDFCFEGFVCGSDNDCSAGYSCVDAYYGAGATPTKSCVQNICLGICPVSGGEECDDGNTQNGDGCSDACLDETCVYTSGSVGGVLEQIDFFSFGKKSDIGDRNSDSISDIIIGAIGDSTTNGSLNTALMIYKSASPYVKDVLNIADTTYGPLIAGNAAWLGSTVQNMLDLYDDGTPDISLSAYYDNSINNHGSARVVYNYVERVCSVP